MAFRGLVVMCNLLLGESNVLKNRYLHVEWKEETAHSGIVKWDGIEGSTIRRLYNDNFLKTKFQMPSKEEQEKIGSYFCRAPHKLDQGI